MERKRVLKTPAMRWSWTRRDELGSMDNLDELSSKAILVASQREKGGILCKDAACESESYDG